MENQSNNIEVKKAWYINYEGEINETEGFQFQEEGIYGASTVTYYKTEKGWKKGSSWAGDNTVFTIEEAQAGSKKRKEQILEGMKKDITTTTEKIKNLEQELAGQ